MKFKPTICLDFDGVMHRYDQKWTSPEEILDGPVEGLIDALVKYVEHFSITVFSSRSRTIPGQKAMQDWLKNVMVEPNPRYSVEFLSHVYNKISWATEKPPALVTIDDRAWTFRGQWPTVQELQEFKPWNKIVKPDEDSGTFLTRVGLDAAEWAKEYCRVNPGTDEHVLLGWFANAIERATAIQRAFPRTWFDTFALVWHKLSQGHPYTTDMWVKVDRATLTSMALELYRSSQDERYREPNKVTSLQMFGIQIGLEDVAKASEFDVASARAAKALREKARLEEVDMAAYKRGFSAAERMYKTDDNLIARAAVEYHDSPQLDSDAAPIALTDQDIHKLETAVRRAGYGIFTDTKTGEIYLVKSCALGSP